MTLFNMLVLYLLAVNGMAYLLFAVDKKRAIKGAWRIPEKTLLFWSLLGGWPAAKLAQRQLRHKTYKQPFGHMLNFACGVNLVCAAVIGFAIIDDSTALGAMGSSAVKKMESVVAELIALSPLDEPDRKPLPVVRRLGGS